MAILPQRVRDEHGELRARIEVLRTVADAIGSATTESIREGVGQAYTFLIHQLIPHAQAEEQVLYPTVGRLLRVVESTETMTRDHLEVVRLTEELEALRLQLFYTPVSEADEQALRRVLYGLYAIIKLHLAKEEEIYLPIVEARLPCAGYLAYPFEKLVVFQERMTQVASTRDTCSMSLLTPGEKPYQGVTVF
jgi:iron-sulfur cluster repair protein YtfE (RIC family)